MQKWLKICHTGKMHYVELPSSRQEPSFEFLEAAYRELDCSIIEIVRVRGFDFAFPEGSCPVIIIDECSKITEDPELRINGLCTLGYAPAFDCIVGHALLGLQVGPDVVPCPLELYEHFVQCIEEIFTDFRMER